ncbi:Flagellar protein fliJ [Candidatus Nitrotoga sp. BS]|uniref:flagellar export protein FliJ n=1 Tax=Candidatus Nitrotoga sp. BS TaxID=2890408 RepID=UPI001EF36058|nr:flagellar export protein FliJ [Candidatus Nitrotoga sp. BS]CAH1195892.1 Flagellar protein fliJ [Candidatus Nitrotoga sp. BS]
MTKIFSMQPLVHLAHQKNDDATRKFGQIIQQQQAAQTKLHTLEQYRKDYQTQLQQSVKNGITQISLRNFQDFIRRLDEAVAQQRDVIEQIRLSMNAGRNELANTQRKMKSFDTLAQRHLESEKKVEEKLEQRQQDEHTGRHSALKAMEAMAAKDII